MSSTYRISFGLLDQEISEDDFHKFQSLAEGSPRPLFSSVGSNTFEYQSDPSFKTFEMFEVGDTIYFVHFKNTMLVLDEDGIQEIRKLEAGGLGHLFRVEGPRQFKWSKLPKRAGHC